MRADSQKEKWSRPVQSLILLVLLSPLHPDRLGAGPVQCGQIVEARGDFRVLRPERLLVDRQGSPVQRLGLGVAALAWRIN